MCLNVQNIFELVDFLFLFVLIFNLSKLHVISPETKSSHLNVFSSQNFVLLLLILMLTVAFIVQE